MHPLDPTWGNLENSSLPLLITAAAGFPRANASRFRGDDVDFEHGTKKAAVTTVENVFQGIK